MLSHFFLKCLSGFSKNKNYFLCLFNNKSCFFPVLNNFFLQSKIYPEL